MRRAVKNCKKCGEEKTLERFEALPSGNRRGACRACTYARAKERGYATWGVKTHRQQRRPDIKYRYGVTPEFVDALHKHQGGCCAICYVPEVASSTLNIDHCRVTGKVRGLLCKRCTLGLGYFRDSVDQLRSAMGYLKESREQ